MKISIVTTLYNSSAHLLEFYRRATQVALEMSNDYEIIFVDDGSPDDSLLKVQQIYKTDSHVKIVSLMRNFGHHKAMMTGLKVSSGSLVFLIDSDLEESPEWLPLFRQMMDEQKADVVFGVQSQRKGHFFEQFSGHVFYKIFNTLSDQRVPQNFVTARLMTRQYVDLLLEYQERELYLGGIWSLVGGHQVGCPVLKTSSSQSTYTFRRKLSLFVNAVTSFSNKPLVFIFYMGFMISAFSAMSALAMIIRKLFFGAVQSGWASLMVSIWFLGGLILFSLGIIGIYLSKVFSETKLRPFVQIKKIYDHT